MQDSESVITVSRTFWRTVALLVLITAALLLYRRLLQYYPPMVITDIMTHVKSQHLLSMSLIADLLYFLFVVVFLHLIWATVITISSKPWINSQLTDNSKTMIWLTIFCGHFTLVIALNSWLYPTSLLGFLRHSFLVTPQAIGTMSLILSGVFIFGLYRTIGGVKLTIAATATLILTLINLTLPYNRIQSPQQQPNIIIIGIDGLRPDHLAYKGSPPSMAPALNNFLSHSVIYDRAYSPMARTYVAWMSLLNGHYPVTHGARFNLTSPNQVRTQFDLIEKLKKRNYQTHYAMDERRFNQIDEAYGFDSIIGPKTGAADALIANNADLPIINLLLDHPISKYILPYLYLNRAYGKGYSPTLFNKEVVNSLATDQPNVLATHFCMLHWPFTSREFIRSENIDWEGNYNHFMYKAMLLKMNAQFEDFMARLRQNGQLNNAHVYLFSDHGEGFMLPQDSINNPRYPDEQILNTNAWGHGNNVLNQSQANVLLAYAKFENGEPIQANRVISGLFSLVDIAPSIFAQLKLPPSAELFDGQPLPHNKQPEDTSRMVFVESSIPVRSINTSFINEKAVFSETASKYLVDKNGRLILKPEQYSDFIKKKQRSVYFNHWQLVILPDQEDLVLLDTKNSEWHFLSEYSGSAPWPKMLLSLCKHYRGDPGFDPQNHCKSAESLVINE